MSTYPSLQEAIMIEFTVNDMSCNHCVGAITKAVQAAFPQAQLEFDLAQHKVRVEDVPGADEVKKVIEEAGYTPQLEAA